MLELDVWSFTSAVAPIPITFSIDDTASELNQRAAPGGTSSVMSHEFRDETELTELVPPAIRRLKTAAP